MRKWVVGFLKYQNDQWEDLEEVIKAETFDDAYKIFRKSNHYYKIIYIKQIV